MAIPVAICLAAAAISGILKEVVWIAPAIFWGHLAFWLALDLYVVSQRVRPWWARLGLSLVLCALSYVLTRTVIGVPVVMDWLLAPAILISEGVESVETATFFQFAGAMLPILSAFVLLMAWPPFLVASLPDRREPEPIAA
ncbi:MAG: hypothetical protein AAF449_20270 [Myxococcota bacterium]